MDAPQIRAGQILAEQSQRIRIRGFWNNPNGVTVPDILELVVALMWAVSGAVELRQLIVGKLTSVGIDLLTVMTWPVLAVLGGGIVQRFGWPRVRGMGMGVNDYLWNSYPTPPVSPSEPVDGDAGMGGMVGTNGPI